MATPATDSKTKLTAVRQFAAACGYESEHCEHVTFLAERLFDALRPLHGLEGGARLCLTCAGLLHDIGWIDGQKGHHKRSMEMILSEMSLPFSPAERAMVALTARYHRKAMPNPKHKVYASLSRARKMTVDVLAAILRAADGLDRSHVSAIADVQVIIEPMRIEVVCRTHGDAGTELCIARKKADLMERVFGRKPVFTQVPIKS